MRIRDYVDGAMARAVELRYQAPVLTVEWQQNGCDCGADARSPGPCAECALKDLSALVGQDLAQRWYDACKEEQRAWKALEEGAVVMAAQRCTAN